MTPSGIITLLTDFGTDDPYVGVMKGALLAAAPARPTAPPARPALGVVVNLEASASPAARQSALEMVRRTGANFFALELSWSAAEPSPRRYRIEELTRAVERARSAGLRVTLATVRVQKPGEEAYDRRLAGLEPDGVLVRHWGALMHFSRERSGQKLEVHGDFSLNVTNSLTAQHLLALGLRSVTASHDLNRAQLLELLGAVPRGKVAVPKMTL